MEPRYDDFVINEVDATTRTAAERDQLAASIWDAEMRHTLLDALLRLRQAAGLSRREVARRVGCSPATIARLESEDADPPVSLLQRYARAVGTRLRFPHLDLSQ